METKFILVNSLQDPLVLNLMDYNEHRKDTNLGAATFDLLKLQDDASIESTKQPIYKDGKDRGELRFSISYYPVLKPELVGGQEVLPNTSLSTAALYNEGADLGRRCWYRSPDHTPSKRT